MVLLLNLNKRRDKGNTWEVYLTASQKNKTQLRESSVGEGKMHVHCQE